MNRNLILAALSFILKKLSYKSPAEIYLYPQDDDPKITISYQDGDQETIYIDDLIESERASLMRAIYGLHEHGLITAPIYRIYIHSTEELFSSLNKPQVA